MPQSPYTTLGIAASRSDQKGHRLPDRLGRELGQEDGDARGRAARRSTSAMSEETSVPKMSGKAPNCSATGSQVLEVMKPKPNLAIASRDPVHSS